MEPDNRTYTHERGSLGTSGSNWSFAKYELGAGRGLERPDRNGLKTAELGLAALDWERSEKEVNPVFDCIADITIPKSAEESVEERRQHVQAKDKSSATHCVIAL